MFKNILSIKKFVILGLLTTIMSCGPVYQTRYNYTPPKSFDGRKCINRCLSDKTSCKNSCSSIYNQCLSIAEKRASNNKHSKLKCTKVITSRNRMEEVCESKSVGTSENYSYHCDSDKRACNTQCDNTYNSCYVNCGGNVRTYQVCVAFCDQGK